MAVCICTRIMYCIILYHDMCAFGNAGDSDETASRYDTILKFREIPVVVQFVIFLISS